LYLINLLATKKYLKYCQLVHWYWNWILRKHKLSTVKISLNSPVKWNVVLYY